MTAAAAKPLVVISSRTGNTMILGHAICDAMPGAVLVKPEALPEDLSGFNPILLGFWCDRGMAPEDIQAAAKKLEGKTIGCFATGTYLCRGRIDPALFERMTAMMGGKVTPEREARRLASETHPDRMDLERGVERFRTIFGVNW